MENEKQKQPIVGIDLGTTNSLCAVLENGEPILIPNPHKEVITPSVVGILEDGRVLVGSAARELAVTQPERCAWAFKRWMGTDKKMALGKKEFSATELSSLVLKSLKQDASEYLGQEVKDVVISVPAYFNDQQRKATKLAGELAGLNVRRIVNEPTAAALTYGFHDRDADKKILVFDLGGGTFDVTLMEIFEGSLEILASSGESWLGGEDFTNRMVSWILQQKGMNLETSEMKAPLLVSRLREECERAKKRLNNKQQVSIRVPDEKGFFAEQPDTIQLSYEEFKDINSSLTEKILKPVLRTLRDGNCKVEDVFEVILVGGATRMSLIQDFVEEHLQKTPLCKYNPDEVVALGACIQGALISEDKSVDDIVMTDVCPFTLGISISKEFGKNLQSGYYLPIIHRNTTLPVSKEEVVTTVSFGQRQMKLDVYQGDARKVKDNLHLGTLIVKDIPPGPPGKMVYVRFTYDLNGILDVEAYVPESDKTFQTVLTNHVRGLSEEEIKKAVKNMQKLKFYPRHDTDNQKLLRFGEKIIGEISPYERPNLESALDRFEDALASGDEEYYKSTRETLLIILSSLGFLYNESEEKE